MANWRVIRIMKYKINANKIKNDNLTKKQNYSITNLTISVKMTLFKNKIEFSMF